MSIRIVGVCSIAICICFLINFPFEVSAQNNVSNTSWILERSQPPIIQVPSDASQWESFKQALVDWKLKVRQEINYDDSLYDRADFNWVSSAFNCCFLMMYDQLFYDRERGRYTIDKILSEGKRRFGGYDIVVLWHAYPRIGLDKRNQFDFYRDMPGGLQALKELSDQLHKQGVKVYINYNPWDVGTRREDVDDVEALSQMVASIGADGIFLDTMERGQGAFRQALDKARKGVVLESELALPVEEIAVHHMSWAQWFGDSYVPGILRNKWIEPRHMQHGISRWTEDKSKELQTAWMNGSGMMVWENVFGQWVGWSPRDSYLLKTMYGIQHYFAHVFSSDNWEPLVGNVVSNGVYANLWTVDNCRLWTLVNRSFISTEGPLLQVDKDNTWSYYDLVEGIEVFPDDSGIIRGKLVPRGIGCIAAFKKDSVPADLNALLSIQRSIAQEKTVDTESFKLKAILKPVSPTKLYKRIPHGMVPVESYEGELPVVFNCREVGYYSSLEHDFINRGAVTLHQKVTFSRHVKVGRIAIDETPVTNAQYKEFLDATGYKPRFPQNFLRHWVDGKIPEGLEQHPVVYIDLEDARAYARWAGKRLPREEEWQLAAAGKEMRKYPWGDEWLSGRCNEHTDGTTTSVKAYPLGKSSCGAWDMCSNTWELTESEYNDGRNRFCILKGGSCYKAEGSDWYFDGGAQTSDFAAKQLLLYPGIDRCSTVGFRCVVDLK